MASNNIQGLETAPSVQPQLKGRKAVALVAALTLCVLTAQLNSTMLAPAIPNIAASLNESPARASQVLSLYLLTGAIAGVVLSRWSDFLGHRRTLFIVLAFLGVGTALCAWSPNMEVLLAGRALQGASSAAFPITFVLLREMLTPKTFGIAVGTITAVNGGVGGVDAYFSGLLVDTFGFRSIFVVILLTGILAAISVRLWIPADSRRPASGKMDWWGAATLSVGLISLTTSLSQAPMAGWVAPATVAYFAVAAAAFIAFWMIEKRRATPLIAVEHLRSRHVWPVIATTILALAGYVSTLGYTIVILSQDGAVGFGMSAAQSALIYIVPGALAGVLLSPLCGAVVTRIGWLRLLRSGLLLIALTLAVLTAFRHDLVVVAVLAFLLGAFFTGIVLTTLNGLGVLLSPDGAPSALAGLNSAAVGIGASLGIGIVASFVDGSEAGYFTALWVSAVIALLAFAASLLITPKPGQTL